MTILLIHESRLTDMHIKHSTYTQTLHTHILHCKHTIHVVYPYRHRYVVYTRVLHNTKDLPPKLSIFQHSVHASAPTEWQFVLHPRSKHIQPSVSTGMIISIALQ